MKRGTSKDMTAEALCRRAAKLAGYDPDERVERVGNKPWPRWCEYRTSVDTQMATEQAKEAVTDKAEQPLEYRDKPFKVFGEHNEATLLQMRNCMSTGKVMGGTICADGHIGYAQPVGGVIAYRDQISLSGVGFDIACFTGDTEIYCLNNKSYTFAELENKEVGVLSCNANGTPVPAEGICRKTRTNAELVKVYFDNGKHVRCTPDHLFMLRNGTYLRADKLVKGESLMPLHKVSDKRGYARDLNSWAKVLVEHVETLTELEDVYCLTVPGLNNFALDCGVFVHNCGNKAVRLDIPYSQLKGKETQILADIRKNISFGVGHVNNTRVEHEIFDDRIAWTASGMEDFRQKARSQLGTVGGGNHFVDIFRDENDWVWIGVHFGSRGLGHTIATRYIKAAGGKDGMHVSPTVLDTDSMLGQDYLHAMVLAGRYAWAGRDWVVERVRQIIGGNIKDTVHNFHNFAWQENHGGEDVWVVRKGATPAFPGQQGFVGGSMGDNALIIEGVDSQFSKDSWYSTIHGAGRLFSRTQAKKQFSREQMNAWLREKEVYLSGGDLDESPMAYRRLDQVITEHQGTIRVKHTLQPFAVAMAGVGEVDPYKD